MSAERPINPFSGKPERDLDKVTFDQLCAELRENLAVDLYDNFCPLCWVKSDFTSKFVVENPANEICSSCVSACATSVGETPDVG